jgi:cold shock CspA family protein
MKMADIERGVVMSFNPLKGYGFIRRPNQPADAKGLFFHVSENPSAKTDAPAQGDEVEYNFVANGKKGPEARGLKITAKSPAVPVSPPSTATPPPAGAAHPSRPSAAAQVQHPPLKGRLIFFAPQEQEVEDLSNPAGAKLIQWRVRVDVEIDSQTEGKPVAEVAVSLKCNGEQVTFPFDSLVTTSEGKASFFSVIAKGALAVYYEAKANGTDRVYTISDYYDPMEKNLPDPVTSPIRTAITPSETLDPTVAIPAPPILVSIPSTIQPQLQVTASDGPGYKQFDITYGAQGALVSVTFIVSPTRGCQLACREQGQADWQTQPGKFDFPSNGRKVVQVKIERLAPDVGGENILIGVQGTTVQSGLHYISRHQ